MRFREIIQEKTIIVPDNNGMNFIVFHNPSRVQFHKLTANKECELKGWLCPNDIWCWSAWHAHHQIAYALGLDPLNENLTSIFVRSKGVLVNDSKKEIKKYYKYPILHKIYGSNFFVDTTQ